MAAGSWAKGWGSKINNAKNVFFHVSFKLFCFYDKLVSTKKII